MLKRILIGLLAVLLVFTAYMYLKLRNNNEPLSPEISFIADYPLVDGVLDEKLKDFLPKREFEYKFNLNMFKGPAGSSYRMAYGTDFIYLYIEAKADSFICRNRGYQNGDGLILTLTSTKPESNESNENYILGFSAQNDPNQKWAEKVLWYYNGLVKLTTLNNDVQFEYQAKEGRIGFEVLLPWSKVYPYHPWISEGIGFNLSLMKAIPDRRMPNVQGVVFEIPSESGPRKYKKLVFAEPALKQNCQSYLILEKNHCNQGDNVLINATVLSAKRSVENFNISIDNEIGELVKKDILTSQIESGVSNIQFEIQISELPPGNYTVRWQRENSNNAGILGLTILPQFNYATVLDKLEEAKTRITEGSLATMEYYSQEINNKIVGLKDYENCPEILHELNEFQEILGQIESGIDTISKQSGIFRRAFRSELDNSLQPYKIQVPNDYDKSNKYPLLVFLHGSGRTDEYMFDTYHQYLSEGNFIHIAPGARGISHYYGTETTQFDIKEAIRDALVNYTIDTANIILAGFSMGGYGVYRTFIETPRRFKKLAVFSGEPKAGIFRKSIGGKYPNFLKKRNLKKLRDVPIFIYHGKNDLNCPYDLTYKLVEKLRSSGGNVEFVSDESAGHDIPMDGVILAKYYNWLNN